MDNELRFSLRSLELYGRNVGTVYILGERPDWLRNVLHLPYADLYDRKCDNTWYKMKRFCEVHRQPFVLMNDDFFLLQHTDMAALPYYYDGSISSLLGIYKRESKYKDAQTATLAVLEKSGYPTLNFAVHYPMIVEPVQMTNTWELFGKAPGISFRNLYGNAVNHKRAMPMKDVKIKQAGEEQGLPAFSISDAFLTPEGKHCLQTHYPMPSAYESKN